MILDHRAKHGADCLAFGGQPDVIRGSQVLAIPGEVQPAIRLTILAIGIAQFAQKVSLLPPFRPCFPQIAADRAGGPANLTD
jgi:hypothetical protein